MIKLRDYQQDILNGIYQSFLSGNKRPLVQSPCGSGKTVIFVKLAELTQAKGNSVVVLVHRRELLRQTLDTFSFAGADLDGIEVHMAQTYSRHLDEHDKPDLIITDECHMAAAATWRRIFDHWPDAYVVGFSASPCRLDGKPLGEIFDDLILGVDTAELIKRGWLSDYEYYSINIADLTQLRKKGQEYDLKDAEEKLSTREIYGDVIKHHQELAGNLQTVVYCPTIKHSKETASAFKAAGYAAEHIDGSFSPKQRDLIVEMFRSGETQVLTNCDIVSTGFDLPSIGCCVMLRPTMSTALFIQQSGRALRPRAGKTAVILDHVGNYTRHGLPADHREWSLDARVDAPALVSEQGMFLIRQCRECYACFEAKYDVCPACGAEYELTGLEIKNIKEIRLEKIAAEEQEARDVYLRSDAALAAARSYSDYCEIAKARGYKTGWARYRAKAAGYWVPY